MRHRHIIALQEVLLWAMSNQSLPSLRLAMFAACVIGERFQLICSVPLVAKALMKTGCTWSLLCQKRTPVRSPMMTSPVFIICFCHRTDRPTDRWTDGRTDGRTDEDGRGRKDKGKGKRKWKEKWKGKKKRKRNGARLGGREGSRARCAASHSPVLGGI